MLLKLNYLWNHFHHLWKLNLILNWLILLSVMHSLCTQCKYKIFNGKVQDWEIPRKCVLSASYHDHVYLFCVTLPLPICITHPLLLCWTMRVLLLVQGLWRLVSGTFCPCAACQLCLHVPTLSKPGQSTVSPGRTCIDLTLGIRFYFADSMNRLFTSWGIFRVLSLHCMHDCLHVLW